MKIECEIEWFDDEKTPDANFKDAVIKEAARQMVGRMNKEGYEALEKRASSAFAAHIDELMLKLTDRFMNKEIIVTNKWGDIQEKYESVDELLKSKFDTFLAMSVDDKGKSTKSCSYGRSRTRVEYLIDKSIDRFGTEMERAISNEMEKKLKEKKTAAMKEAGAKMAKHLGLT